jgi:hypothetical protein
MEHYIYYDEKDPYGHWVYSHREVCSCEIGKNHWVERPEESE